MTVSQASKQSDEGGLTEVAADSSQEQSLETIMRRLKEEAKKIDETRKEQYTIRELDRTVNEFLDVLEREVEKLECAADRQIQLLEETKYATQHLNEQALNLKHKLGFTADV